MSIFKKVWYYTCFRWYSIVYHLGAGKVLDAIILPGIFLALLYMYGYQEPLNDFNDKLDVVFSDNSWQRNNNGQLYLNKYIRVDIVPLGLSKEEVIEKVASRIKFHNDMVDVREKNRRMKLVVKGNEQFDVKLKAYFTDDVEVDGRISPTIWIMSTNTSMKNEKLENKVKAYGVEIK